MTTLKILILFMFLFACGSPDNPKMMAKETKKSVQVPKKSPEKITSDKKLDSSEKKDASISQTVHKKSDIEQQLSSGKIVFAKSMSSRSLSFKVRIKGGIKAAFKPVLITNYSARAEVAFYKLSKWLGVGTVPVSSIRFEYPSRLMNFSNISANDKNTFLAEVKVDDNGKIEGAMIEWLFDIETPAFSGKRAMIELKKLFRHPSTLTKNISDVLVIDYIFGNWDRFSGGNIFKFKNSDELALIDHNGAFYALNKRQHKRLINLLNLSTCFSKDLFDKISKMTTENITTTLTIPNYPHSLLSKTKIENIIKRRDALVEYLNTRAQNETSLFSCNP